MRVWRRTIIYMIRYCRSRSFTYLSKPIIRWSPSSITFWKSGAPSAKKKSPKFKQPGNHIWFHFEPSNWKKKVTQKVGFHCETTIFDVTTQRPSATSRCLADVSRSTTQTWQIARYGLPARDLWGWNLRCLGMKFPGLYRFIRFFWGVFYITWCTNIWKFHDILTNFPWCAWSLGYSNIMTPVAWPLWPCGTWKPSHVSLIHDKGKLGHIDILVQFS